MLTEVATHQNLPLPLWRGSQSGRPLAGLTVLMVEDSRVASEAVRLLCLRSGARIRRADCLESARRHLRCYRPNVVIIDLGLPDGNGADLIRQIAETRPRIPVILAISGEPDARKTAMTAGADGFMAKPIESLAAFQRQIIALLDRDAVAELQCPQTDEVIRPDISCLREDLIAASNWLAQPQTMAEIDYIARFLAGIGRSGHDDSLEEAASSMAREYRAGRMQDSQLIRMRGMIRERLARVADA